VQQQKKQHSDTGDRAWLDHAACLDRPDLDWFDLGCTLQELVTVCATCPVQTQCLDYAISIDATDGVWAGQWGYRLNQGGPHDQT
jgi:WhiB family transcriptional regulator, redox-sensing transcriptional regulator